MNRQEILAVILANVRRVVLKAGDREIEESTSLKALSASHLEVVEVASRSMLDLRLKIQRGELAGAASVKDLVDIFERAAAVPALR